MGNLFSSLYFYFFITGDKCRLMMVGLDNAGKTTALNQLKLRQFAHTVPTLGFNLEKISYEGLDFNIWDIGGQEKIRSLWLHYAEDNDGVIFMIDASDTERLELARVELRKLFSVPSLKEVPYCIFLNKQDLPGAIKKDQMEAQIYTEYDGKMFFSVFECIAKDEDNDGLIKGLDWLYKTLKERKLPSFLRGF